MAQPAIAGVSLGRRGAALGLAAGHAVHATTRRSAEANAFRSQGLNPVICDVLDSESLKWLPPVDTALYAVGFDRSGGATMRSVYVEGLARVLDHLPPPGRFM